MASLSRRAFFAVVALFAHAGRVAAASAGPTVAAAAVTLDEFVALSERLMERSKLDREIARIYLHALNSELRTAVDLATLADNSGNLTPEQSAIARTIIEWWYTGVYTVDGKPRLATHTGALMWSAMDMPAPGTCAAPFGAWSRPPRTLA